MKNGCVFLTVLCVLPSSLLAQEVSGNLQGRVVALKSEPVADVRVTVAGPSLQGTRTTQTDARGFFQLLALPAGGYTVRLARIGFRPVVFESVPVRIGATTNLGLVTLEPQAVELGEIAVNAQRLSIDPASTTIGANVDAATYDALPVGRDYRSVVEFLPHANTSYYPGDPVNIGGATGLENGYYIDGVNVTPPHFQGSLPVSSFVLPYNFVRAVEVKEGGYDARYGRVIGGTVNAVTYSGGNRFEGDVFAFFTNSALTGPPRIGLKDVRNDNLSSYDVGARVGGPILRDRLWFSVAYNPQVESADRAVPDWIHYPDRLRRQVFAGKLTWQAAASTSVELLVFGDRSTHHEVTGALFSAYAAVDTVANPDPYRVFSRGSHTSGSLQLTHHLGAHALLEATIARATSFSQQGAETARGDTEALFLDYITSTLSGGLSSKESPRDARTAATLRGTLELGTHTLVAGAEYEDNRFSDTSVSHLVLRLDSALWVKDSTLVPWTVHNRVPTLYVEDSWRMGARLTVDAGLRWAAEYVYGSSGLAQTFPNEWQPRLGASYQLGRLGTQRLFGSWGIYYQQQPLDIASGFYVPYPESWTYYSSDPRLPGTSPDSVADVSTYPTQYPNIRGLKVEHHREVALGYERLVGASLKLTARAMRRDLLSAFGFGLDTADARYWVLGVPGEGALSFLPKMRRSYTALELSAEWAGRDLQARCSYVVSRAYGNFTGFYASDYGVACPGCFGGLQIAEERKNSTGLLPNDRTHVVKLSGAYRWHFGVTTGAFVTWQSGTPLNEFGVNPTYTRATFLVPRGSAGRTPAIWDLNLRLAYPFSLGGGVAARATLDWLHVGSPRRPVWLEPFHYVDEDANGNPINPNPTYGQVRSYQPPTQARLGVEFTF
jgi:hypothetical protein